MEPADGNEADSRLKIVSTEGKNPKMTVVNASRARVVFDQSLTLVLASAFPALYLFSIRPDPNLPTLLKSAIAIISLCCAAYFLYTLVKICRLLMAKGPWRAVIENGRLHWVTGLPHKDFPIDVDLDSIAMAVQLVTFSKGTDNDTDETHTFELQFLDGSSVSISQEDSGLNPHRVFMALKDHGVIYRRYVLDMNKDQKSAVREVDHDY